MVHILCLTVDSYSGLKVSVSKAKRLIVVHAESENGFVENALQMFQSGSKSGVRSLSL